MRDRRRERDVTSWPGGTLEADVPAGVDRRAFLMRSAVVGAAAVLTGWNAPAEKEAAAPAAAPPAPKPAVSADLEIVKKARGPVMTSSR